MNKPDVSRRNFLKNSTGLAAGIMAASASLSHAAPSRASGAKYRGDFAAPKIDTVRVAIIGVGARGSGHIKQLAAIEGTEVVAICDLYEDYALRAKGFCDEAGQGARHTKIKLYHGEKNHWKKMLREVRPDMVIIATPWVDHAPMAIETMKQGAHAFVEVPLGLTAKELWEVIDTSEATGKHCMMMENVNYGREELLYLNLCRKGMIGELLHAEAAYIHELRGQMEQVERGTGSWRTFHYAKRNGNLYPTHGLGPVAQYMNLGRGDDNFGSLVSYSSPALGRALYSQKNYAPDHQWNQLDYRGGDMNTSIIKTTMGRTVLVQWDETSPRPYTRLNLIQGTLGALASYPTRIALEGGVPGITENHHKWAEGEALEAFMAQHDHPLYKRMGELATRMGGHGGMDFLMRYRMVDCLRKGQPLDQNVYEGAFWSVVSELSEDSVAHGGAPQAFPDFTRGNWKTTAPLGIVS